MGGDKIIEIKLENAIWILFMKNAIQYFMRYTKKIFLKEKEQIASKVGK